MIVDQVVDFYDIDLHIIKTPLLKFPDSFSIQIEDVLLSDIMFSQPKKCEILSE